MTVRTLMNDTLREEETHMKTLHTSGTVGYRPISDWRSLNKSIVWRMKMDNSKPLALPGKHKLLFFVAIACVMLCVPAMSLATPITFDPSFNTTNQSMWASGPGFKLEGSEFLGGTFTNVGGTIVDAFTGGVEEVPTPEYAAWFLANEVYQAADPGSAPKSSQDALNKLDQHFSDSVDPHILNLKATALAQVGRMDESESLQKHLRTLGFNGG